MRLAIENKNRGGFTMQGIQKFNRVVAFGLTTVMVLGTVSFVQAIPTESSLLLDDSRPSQTTDYTFNTSTLAGTSLQCIELDLGANSDGTGAITGLDTSGSSLSSSTLIDTGNWAVDNTASAGHTLRATYATGETPSASGNIVWGGVDNGTVEDTGYFGVFSTYSDAACSTLVESTTVQFIYTDGQQVSLTVDPSFTFTVAGVADSQSVNGATTTVTTTATTVPFGQVTIGSNGIAAQDLEIGTNAQNGYNIYARYTDPLTNASSDEITNHTGTNGTPTSFSAAGTEAFGYTTDDLFGTNLWAGFTTTNAPVATSATSITGTETTRVGFQAGVDTDTPAGTYTTTVIYTAVPAY